MSVASGYAYVVYEGDGVQTDFTIPFEKISQTHINVFIAGVEFNDFVWQTDSVVRIDPAPTERVLIERQTSPGARLVNYEAPGQLTEQDLDTDSLQAFYLAQESYDVVDRAITVDPALGTASVSGNRIVDLAPGIDDTDAATVGQLAPFAEDAEDARNDAIAARNAAQVAQAAAELAESGAETAETGSVAASNKAQEWAENPEDDPVEPGQFSALHWAAKAEEYADSLNNLEVTATGTTTPRALADRFGDAVTPYDFGAEVNAATDQQAALQNMLSSGAPVIFLPAGVWRADSDLTCDHDVHIYGPGVLDFSNGADAQLHISGSLSVLDSLSGPVTRGTRGMSWASAQGLAAGDIVILWDPTDFSNGGRRAVYRDGMMFKVHSVDGASVNTYELAVDSYGDQRMNVYKMNPVKAKIEGITVKPCTTAEAAPVKVSLGADIIIRDVKSLSGGNYGGIQVDRCYNVVFDCVSPENNSPHVNNEYGIIISNSQHVRVTGSASFATRHAVTLGGTDEVATVPNLFVTISGMSLWNAPDTMTGAGDVHGNANYVTYENCTMAGFSGGGRNIKLVGCTIFGMPEAASGLCVTMPETNGGYINFLDCEFRSYGDGDADGHGYLYIQALGANAGGNPPEASIREAVEVRVEGCRFLTPSAGANAKMVLVSASNAGVAVNVTVNNCKWNSPQGLAFLLARETVDSSLLSSQMIVDNVYGPDGAYFLYPDASIAGVPTRQMTQSGYTAHTTTATNVNAAPEQHFRYRYSRLPSAQVAVSSGDGSDSGTTAGQPASPKVYQINEELIRPAIVAGSAFASGTSIRLHWSVGLADV